MFDEQKALETLENYRNVSIWRKYYKVSPASFHPAPPPVQSAVIIHSRLPFLVVSPSFFAQKKKGKRRRLCSFFSPSVSLLLRYTDVRQGRRRRESQEEEEEKACNSPSFPFLFLPFLSPSATQKPPLRPLSKALRYRSRLAPKMYKHIWYIPYM